MMMMMLLYMYNFGILVDWTRTELQSLDRMRRKVLDQEDADIHEPLLRGIFQENLAGEV